MTAPMMAFRPTSFQSMPDYFDIHRDLSLAVLFIPGLPSH